MGIFCAEEESNDASNSPSNVSAQTTGWRKHGKQTKVTNIVKSKQSLDLLSQLTQRKPGFVKLAS